MKMSEKKQVELYQAISNSIDRERVNIQAQETHTRKAMDYRLYKLEQDIWQRVHAILNLEGPA